MDDRAAIAACRAGRADAFEAVVRRYERQAIGHALALLGQRQDAEDAVQDAFVQAFRALDRFDDARPFYPWLYTILRNRCFKALARRREARARGDAALAADEAARLLAAPADAGARDAAAEVDDALRRLSAEDRELVTLKHLDGLTYDEIAERLGVPRGTVMSRLFAARGRLRDKLTALQRKEDRP